MKQRISCILVLLLCCPVFGYAQNFVDSGETLSLKDALESALDNNPLYEGRKSDVAAARGLLRQAGLWNNPDLFFEAEEWPIKESFDQSHYKLGLSQEVPFPGKMGLEKRVAETTLSEAKAQRSANRAVLIRRVRVAFFRLLLSKRILEIGKQLNEVAHSSMNIAKARSEAGESTAQEVLRAEIQFERVKSDQADYTRDYRTAQSQLAVLLGRPENSHFIPSGTLRTTVPSELLDRQGDAKLDEHPLIIAAEIRVRRAQAELERSSLEPFPNLTLSLSGGRREATDETLVDLELSLPLPLINTSKGNREAAVALLRKAQAALSHTRQSLQNRLELWRQALTQLNTQIASYRIELLPRAEKALAMVQTGFKEGEYGFNDLLDTQRTTAEMRLLYETKLFELNQAIAEMKSLLDPNDKLIE